MHCLILYDNSTAGHLGLVSVNQQRRGMQFLKFMIPFWKHEDQRRHQRRVSEDDQSVAIQLPPAEDVGDRYH